jgi:hypothetical protein
MPGIVLVGGDNPILAGLGNATLTANNAIKLRDQRKRMRLAVEAGDRRERAHQQEVQDAELAREQEQAFASANQELFAGTTDRAAQRRPEGEERDTFEARANKLEGLLKHMSAAGGRKLIEDFDKTEKSETIQHSFRVESEELKAAIDEGLFELAGDPGLGEELTRELQAEFLKGDKGTPGLISARVRKVRKLLSEDQIVEGEWKTEFDTMSPLIESMPDVQEKRDAQILALEFAGSKDVRKRSDPARFRADVLRMLSKAADDRDEDYEHFDEVRGLLDPFLAGGDGEAPGGQQQAPPGGGAPAPSPVFDPDTRALNAAQNGNPREAERIMREQSGETGPSSTGRFEDLNEASQQDFVEESGTLETPEDIAAFFEKWRIDPHNLPPEVEALLRGEKGPRKAKGGEALSALSASRGDLNEMRPFDEPPDERAVADQRILDSVGGPPSKVQRAGDTEAQAAHRKLHSGGGDGEPLKRKRSPLQLAQEFLSSIVSPKLQGPEGEFLTRPPQRNTTKVDGPRRGPREELPARVLKALPAATQEKLKTLVAKKTLTPEEQRALEAMAKEAEKAWEEFLRMEPGLLDRHEQRKKNRPGGS